MRVISKQILIDKLQGGTSPYISKSKLMFLVSLYGQDIEVKEEENEQDERSGQVAGPKYR